MIQHLKTTVKKYLQLLQIRRTYGSVRFVRYAFIWIFASTSYAQDFAWSENSGWLNWSPSNGINQGPVPELDAISGYVWGENIGWINLGDGVPVPETSVQTGADFGVGVDFDGDLFGYAWGENIGWVNFGPFPTTPDQPRYIRGRILGYAWAENIGWINLNDEEHFVQLTCAADLTGDGVLDFFDISAFLDFYSGQSPRADWDDDGQFDFFDVSAFLDDFAQTCS